MKDVQQTLDRLVPEATVAPDWEGVIRDAWPRRRSRMVQLAVATGIVAAVALFVVAPWRADERVGILDRALAAAGDGPVLHVVLRGGWGGTLVDLKTGERQPVYGEREVWFDPSRDLVHQVERFGGVVQSDDLYERNKGDGELTALWRDYRPALENGTARVVGKGVVDGSAVYWIIVRALMLPDVADHRNHELAQQVAISQESFKPVAMRYTRDKKPSPDGTEHILRFETISAGEGNFTSAPGGSLNGFAVMGGRDTIDLSRAANALGRGPLWLGREFGGLPLGQAQEVYSATGRREETLVTGPRADEMRRCLRLLRSSVRRARPVARPAECRGLPGAEVRGDKVYLRGPVHFGPRKTGLALFYGAMGDDPTTFKKESSAPLYSEPHIVLTEKTDRTQDLLGISPLEYVPPEGSVLLMPGSSGYLGATGSSGYLARDGVYISIQAADEQTILEAAKALRPLVSAGSGGGW